MPYPAGREALVESAVFRLMGLPCGARAQHPGSLSACCRLKTSLFAR